jgi:hypothetical protein
MSIREHLNAMTSQSRIRKAKKRPDNISVSYHLLRKIYVYTPTLSVSKCQIMSGYVTAVKFLSCHIFAFWQFGQKVIQKPSTKSLY